MLDPIRKEGGQVPSPTKARLFGAFLLLLFLFSACSPENTRGEQDPLPDNGTSYAERLSIEERSYGHSVLIGKSKEGDEKLRYKLVEKGKKLEKKEGEATRIEVPVERIACLSSTHVGMLSALDGWDRIVAFSRKKYLYDRKLRERMENGKVEAVGMQRSLDKERLVALDADILLHDGMGTDRSSSGRILRNSGIPEMALSAWREEHPLGRAEWLRLFGILIGKKEKADSIFQERAQAYDSIASMASERKERPKVLTNAPHKGTWHVPGGESYKGQAIEDAGGKNPWKKEKRTGGIPKSLEEVIAKAEDADIWIEPGRAKSLQGLASRDVRLKGFEALEEGEVYNNDRRNTKEGGNDYWESGPVNPHLVLKDLITIFHPDLFPDRDLHYYRRLAKEKGS
jgi:iron complex transport system substrate-binding protein